MARKMTMTDLHQLVMRIRNGQSNTFINQTCGTHKTVIRKLRKLALENNWLSSEQPLPDEKTVHQKYYQDTAAAHHASKNAVILSRYQTDIQRWLNDKKSFVVIHALLRDRLGDETPCETTIRNFVHKAFPEKIKPAMIRTHEYGCAEIDFGYFGLVHDGTERRTRKAWFLTCRFAFSRYAYRKVVYSTDSATTIHALEDCFWYFEALPRTLVLDNFKAAIQKASLYDPIVTKLFYEFAKYYGLLLSPCRVGKPEHKGGSESDVKYVKKNFWPIFCERQKNIGHETPRAEDLPEAFDAWTNETNMRFLKPSGECVARLFDEEYESLAPLPNEKFDILSCARPMVRRDFHVQFDNNFYSVPDRLIGKTIDVYGHFRQIRMVFEGEIVAVHERLTGRGRKSTIPEHCTDIGYEYMSYSREVVQSRARTIGPSTGTVIDSLFADKVIDRLRSARGIVFLTKKYPKERIEAACARALFFGNISYPAIKRILEREYDKLPLSEAVDEQGQYWFSFARKGTYYQN